MSQLMSPNLCANGHSFAYLFERFPSFVQTFVYREALEMVRQGMAPLLVSIRRPDDPANLAEPLGAKVLYLPEEKELRAEVDRLRAAGKLPWRAHRAVPRHRQAPDAQRMFEAIALAPELQRRGIGHVHAHFGGLAARTAWWLRRLFGIRYSFTGHANDIFCESGSPITNADLVRSARFVVTETDFARHWMEEKHPGARGKVFRVFNGIALDGFPPRSPAPGLPRLVSVGRSVEKKGFGHLIEACRLLRERGRECECLIIGGGPLEGELQAQIDRAALWDRVHLLGPRPQSEVRELLASAHVFALACSHETGGGSDNLPTVIMEAMACGVPVLSTRVAGVPEMISDDCDGLLVPPGDPPALAAAAERLLAAPELADRLRAEGQRTARGKFAIENTTRELKHLLARRAGLTIPHAALQQDPALGRRWWQRWTSRG